MQNVICKKKLKLLNKCKKKKLSNITTWLDHDLSDRQTKGAAADFECKYNVSIMQQVSWVKLQLFQNWTEAQPQLNGLSCVTVWRKRFSAVLITWNVYNQSLYWEINSHEAAEVRTLRTFVTPFIRCKSKLNLPPDGINLYCKQTSEFSDRQTKGAVADFEYTDACSHHCWTLIYTALHETRCR